MIEEANKVIEEFNDEKHLLKAKFKHLLFLLSSSSEDFESSYRSSDSIDLDLCFEQFEQEFMKQRQKVDQ